MADIYRMQMKTLNIEETVNLIMVMLNETSSPVNNHISLKHLATTALLMIDFKVNVPLGNMLGKSGNNWNP